ASQQIASIEGVGLFCGGKPGVLTHRPGSAHVHGRIGAAQKGGQPRHRVQMLQTDEVSSRIEGLHRDLFRRVPGELVDGFPRLSLHLGLPIGHVARCCVCWVPADVFEIRNRCHHVLLSVGKRLSRAGYRTPSSFKSARKVSGTLHFTKMNWLTPTLRYFISLAAGLPANTTVRAPAALNVGASRSTPVA